MAADDRNTGFRGRIGIYELLTCTEAVRELVMNRASARSIAKCAIDTGDLVTLRSAGFDKIRAGVTTFPEVLRATKL